MTYSGDNFFVVAGGCLTPQQRIQSAYSEHREWAKAMEKVSEKVYSVGIVSNLKQTKLDKNMPLYEKSVQSSGESGFCTSTAKRRMFDTM